MVLMIFFVNVGPKLAENTDCCDNDTSVLDYLGAKNDKSMFLEPVVEQEVSDIVNNCASKTSLDWEDFSMTTVKKNCFKCVKAVYTYM